MDEEERFELLLEVLEELRERNEEVPIVVEGVRDVASLRLLGIAGHVIPLHSGEPLFQVAESIAQQSDEVILLTDWDRKGGILFDQLAASLSANGVRIDGTFRDRIRHAIRPTLNDVESLAGYVARRGARLGLGLGLGDEAEG